MTLQGFTRTSPVFSFRIMLTYPVTRYTLMTEVYNLGAKISKIRTPKLSLDVI